MSGYALATRELDSEEVILFSSRQRSVEVQFLLGFSRFCQGDVELGAQALTFSDLIWC